MRTVAGRIGAIVAGSALLACSSSSGGSGSGWAGTWACNLTDTLMPATGPSQTSSWMEDFTITEGSNGLLTVTPVVDSGQPCSFTATESGTTATVRPSVPCDDPNGTYGGTLTLNGNSLDWTYNGSGASGGFDEQASCTRP